MLILILINLPWPERKSSHTWFVLYLSPLPYPHSPLYYLSFIYLRSSLLLQDPFRITAATTPTSVAPLSRAKPDCGYWIALDWRQLSAGSNITRRQRPRSESTTEYSDVLHTQAK